MFKDKRYRQSKEIEKKEIVTMIEGKNISSIFRDTEEDTTIKQYSKSFK